MEFLVKLAASILRRTGYKDLADWLTNAPDKVAEEVLRILGVGMDENGLSLSDSSRKQLEALKLANPAEGRGKPHDLLEQYLEDLHMIVANSEPLKAIAIRGFFHDKECLTVWNFSGTGRKAFKITGDLFNANNPSDIFISGSGTEIFIGKPVDDRQLENLNLQIENDVSDFLEHTKKEYYAQILSLTKNTVKLSVVNNTTGKETDQSVSITNPQENIKECFLTLEIAKNAQAKRNNDYQAAADKWRKKDK